MKAFMTDPMVRWVAVMLAVVMGLVSLVPRVEASFVPSDQRASSISRQEDMATIERALEQKLVRERLKDLGYTEEEIKARLDRLSDAEVHSLASQLDSLMPAGSWEAVVIVILLFAIVVVLYFMWVEKKVVLY
ncbi:MAG TPA: PA2779 family protein [Syntrophobacteria bacterium]|nr:PA2779 family protein [Syntrophobacteria bacterium]